MGARYTIVATVLLGSILFSAAGFSAELRSKVILAQGVTGRLGLLDVLSGKLTTISVGPLTHGVGVLPDGTRAYATSFGVEEVSVVDLKTKQEIGKVNVKARSHHLAVSPDSKWVYVSGAADTIAVIDTGTNTMTKRIPVAKGPVYTVFAPDGDHAYVSSTIANLVVVIDTSRMRVVKEIPVGAEPSHLAITPDSRYLYTTNAASNDVSVIDTTGTRVIATIPVGKSPHGIAVGERQGRLLVYVGNRGETSLSVIDAKSNQVIERVSLGLNPEHLTASPDGKYVYIGSPATKSLLVFDVTQGGVVKQFDVGAEIHQIAIVPPSEETESK